MHALPTLKNASPAIKAIICDKEGDNFTLEAEVVPRDTLMGPHVATHSQTISFKQVPPLSYEPEPCAEIVIPLLGFPDAVTHRVFLRTDDS